MSVLNDADALKWGATTVTKAFMGSTEVWPAAGSGSILDDAIWWVEASTPANGDTELEDLSGGVRNMELQGAPTILPYSGTRYVYIPPVGDAGNNVSIAGVTVGSAWTATRTDATTLTGTTAADPWVFTAAGSWTDVRTDDNDYIFGSATSIDSDELGATNPGVGGGAWTINRANAVEVESVAVVDRAKVSVASSLSSSQLFVPGLLPGSDGNPWTIVAAVNRFVAVPHNGGQYANTVSTATRPGQDGMTMKLRSVSNRFDWRTFIEQGGMVQELPTFQFPASVGSRTTGVALSAALGQELKRYSHYIAESGGLPAVNIMSAATNNAAWPYLTQYTGLTFLDSYGNDMSGEFVAAAVFDTVLSDSEVAEAYAALNGE